MLWFGSKCAVLLRTFWYEYTWCSSSSAVIFCSKGRHALWVQDLQLILSSAVRLIEAYESSLVQSFISSSHIRRGLPLAILPSSLPSSIWIALTLLYSDAVTLVNERKLVYDEEMAWRACITKELVTCRDVDIRGGSLQRRRQTTVGSCVS